MATADRCLADSAPTGCPGQLLVSRDGGAHWTPVLAASGPVFATAGARAGDGPLSLPDP